MAKQVASLFGVLSLDDKDFIRGLGIAKSGILDLESDTKDLGSGITAAAKRVGDKLTEIGGQMTVLGGAITTLTGPLLGFGTDAVQAAMTFDESMANIQAAAGYTTEEMVGIREQVLAIGEDSRYGPAVAAEAFYEIAGGVTDASARMSTFEAAVHAAQAGNASLEGTTSALIAVMNGYGFSADKATFASDALTRMVGMGKGSMDEFAGAIPNVAGLAAGLGIGFDDLSAQMAYLTTKGYTASESSTMLKNMMTSMLNPTADLQAAITDLGYESGRAMIEQEGLTGAYEKLAAYNGGELDGLITNVEALTGASALIGDDFGGFVTSFIDGLTGATTKAEEVQMDSAAAEFDLLNSKLEAMNTTIGTTLMPTLTDLATTGLIPIIEKVSEWASANPQATATIGLLVFAVGALGIALSVAGTAVAAIGTAITVLSGPLGLAVLAVAALGFAYMSNFGGIKDFIDGTVAPILNDFFNTLATVWETVRPGLEQLANFFVTGAIQNMLNVIRIILKVVESVIDLLGAIWAKARPGVEKFAQGIQDVLGPVVDFLGGIVTTINEILAALASDTIKTAGGSPAPIPGYTGTQPKAAGGPVMGGMPYMVGEQGRELFIPDSSGTIVPNGSTEGMMGGVQIGTVVIQAETAEGGRAAADGFDTRLRELRAARG